MNAKKRKHNQRQKLAIENAKNSNKKMEKVTENLHFALVRLNSSNK